MAYKLTKKADVPHKSKFGIELDVYPEVDGAGYVLVETEQGHNEEFYHTVSRFTYFVLEGSGSFFLNDEEVPVEKGDCISIEPNTRIYYTGKMKLMLVTTPAWTEEGEVETREKVW